MMSQNKKPNIVVFMADQMRALGAKGTYPCPTPNLDRLSEEGLRFTDAVCPSPVCSPARASFHTGLSPSNHHVYANVHLTYASDNMDTNIPTLASVLKKQGYRTGISGVWHVSSTRPATDYGFDVEYGEVSPMFKASDAEPLKSIHLPGEAISGKDLLAAEYEFGEGAYSTEKEVSDAVQYLETCAKNPDEPFFLFVSTRIPHVPWKVSSEDLNKVKLEDIDLPESFCEDLNGKNCPDKFEHNGCDYTYWRGTGKELREALQCYYALISKVDEQVGVILDTLKRLKQDEDTLFIFTSDHGEMGGAHNLIGKGFDFYNEVVKVPMIARWPNGIEGGRTVHQSIGFEDIMPTFCELADVKMSERYKGQSLTPFFKGSCEIPWRDTLLLEQYSHVFPGFAVSLRSDDWLYVFDPTRGEQLYDRKNDESESVDLASKTEHQKALPEWRRKLIDHMQKVDHPMTIRIKTSVSFIEMQEKSLVSQA